MVPTYSLCEQIHVPEALVAEKNLKQRGLKEKMIYLWQQLTLLKYINLYLGIENYCIYHKIS